MPAPPATSAPPATRASWKNRPMPEARARIPYSRQFDAAEHGRVVQGLVPAQMEDKWFIFFEDGALYFHRSWTGTCIYALHLRAEGGEGGGSVVDEAWANRAPEEYTRTDDAYDAQLLGFLVERLLLGQKAAFPTPEAIPRGEKETVFRHHVVGHARANDEE
ncbi:MAG TPA: hypothetical protein VIF15_08415 [Polyangiaceae bacterium]|jgi:hypothetical protein